MCPSVDTCRRSAEATVLCADWVAFFSSEDHLLKLYVNMHVEVSSSEIYFLIFKN